jgi:hypothetical protein
MRDLLILIVHLITTVGRLANPGGLRAVVAESVLVKHQLLIVSRSRQRSPNLCNLAFGTSINKDVVRRILALHCRPEPGAEADVADFSREYETIARLIL